MKLLILGVFNVGALENYYEAGFIKSGVNVTKFDITNPYNSLLPENLCNKLINRIKPSFFLKTINHELESFVKNKFFDAVLVFKGMSLFPETILKLKKHTKVICCYNPDHPFKFYSRGSGNKYVSSSIKNYDIYFSYSSKIVSSLIDKYHIPSYCIPFGYDSSLSDKYGIGYNDKTVSSFLFFGAWDRNRALFLKNLQRNDLVIYGDDKWNTCTKQMPLVQKSFKQKKLYEIDLYNNIKSSTGVINILREQNIIEESHNMRTFEVPGYGGLLFSNYTDEQASFFEPGREAFYYSSKDELNDKMNFAQRNPEIMLKIKKNALSRSKKNNYSYDNRSIEMLNIIKSIIKG